MARQIAYTCALCILYLERWPQCLSTIYMPYQDALIMIYLLLVLQTAFITKTLVCKGGCVQGCECRVTMNTIITPIDRGRNNFASGRTKFTTSGAHDVIAITSLQKNDLCTEKLRDKTKSPDEISLPLRKAIVYSFK